MRLARARELLGWVGLDIRWHTLRLLILHGPGMQLGRSVKC
jgi:hypothetical protein